MFKYGLALAALFVSTTAMAQSHEVQIDVEASSGVDVNGDISFGWFAPIPGDPYNTNPDTGTTSTNIAYTSDGMASGVQVSISNDPELEWGIRIEADASTTVCGSTAGPVSLTTTESELISLNTGSCSESISVDYTAEIVDDTVFGASVSGSSATVTYTLL